MVFIAAAPPRNLSYSEAVSAMRIIAFVRQYLKELQDHPIDGPEHEAALLLTLAVKQRAVEECERRGERVPDDDSGTHQIGPPLSKGQEEALCVGVTYCKSKTARR